MFLSVVVRYLVLFVDQPVVHFTGHTVIVQEMYACLRRTLWVWLMRTTRAIRTFVYGCIFLGRYKSLIIHWNCEVI